MQIYKARKVQKFNYEKNNVLIYGSATPPAYDLNQLNNYSVPSLITISDADPFANPQDTLEFIEHINNKEKFVQVLRLTNYNHLDYFWADSAVTEIFPKVLKFLNY